MWIQVFVISGVTLGQAGSPHAGVAIRRHEECGRFQWPTPHAADHCTFETYMAVHGSLLYQKLRAIFACNVQLT